jgi:hypothetical protein
MNPHNSSVTCEPQWYRYTPIVFRKVGRRVKGVDDIPSPRK